MFNKKPIFLIAACLFAASSHADSYIGYTDGTASRNNVFRFTSAKDQRIAIRLSQEKLQLLKGKSITGIRIALGSKQSTNNEATLFLTSSLDAEPITSKTIKVSSTNSLTVFSFDTPYVITGEEQELYLGCKMEIGSQYGAFSADFSGDYQGIAFGYGNGEWQDLYGKGYGAPNIQAIIDSEVSFTDALIKPFKAEGYYKALRPYTHNLELHNFGTTTITSFDATVTIGDGAEKKVTFSDVSIPANGNYTFSLDAFGASVSAQQDISVAISNINGTDDADASDNQVAASAFFYPIDMRKSVLVETFTGQTCTNCPMGHSSMHTAIEQSGADVVEITHHSGYVTDIFSMKEDWTLTSLYNGSTYAPAAMVNRTAQGDAETPVFESYSASADLAAINAVKDEKPYVSISAEASIDPETRQVTVNADFLTHEQMPGDDIRYSIWLVQDSLIASQAGAGTNYVHNAVSRGIITESTWGESASFIPGETLCVTKTFELPDTIISTSYEKADGKNHIETDLSNMRLVVFVHQQSSSDATACRVFNCTETPILTAESEGERLLCRQTYYGDNQGYESIDTAVRTVDYFYDEENRLVRSVETSKDTRLDSWQLTHYYFYKYDNSGNLTQTYSLKYGQFDYGDLGFSTVKDTVTYQYNSLNQLIKEFHPLKEYHYTYDEQGHCITKATWNINSISLDASNDLVEKFSDFNAFGEPCKVTATSPSGKEWYEYTGTFLYDNDGNLIEEKHYELDGTLKYSEYWTYTDGILSEHRLPTVYGDGTETENEKETFTLVNGSQNHILHDIYIYNGETWDYIAGSRCIDDYGNLPMGAPAFTLTPVDGEINTVKADVSANPGDSSASSSDFTLYRSGIKVDGLTDFEVKNGTYEYMLTANNKTSNLIDYEHHVDLPTVKGIQITSTRSDFLTGNTIATISWQYPAIDERLGLISTGILYPDMQIAEAVTDSPSATSLELDFGSDTKKHVFFQSTYKFGKVNTGLITLDLNNTSTGIVSVTEAQASTKQPVFTLTGQRTTATTKGILIQQGRKVSNK